MKTEKEKLELELEREMKYIKILEKSKANIEKLINKNRENYRKISIKIHEVARKNSLLKKTNSEVIKMLSEGIEFRMTKNISRYKGMHCGTKWTDAIVDQHPTSNNRDVEVRMYVPNWRVLGYPYLDSFVEEYNNGLWKEIKK